MKRKRSDTPQEMPDVGEAIKRKLPALDEALGQYRKSREEYDEMRSRTRERGTYRSQRGVQRGYRV